MKKLIVSLFSLSLLVMGCGGETTEEKKEKARESAKKLEEGTNITAVEFNDGIVGLQMNIMEPALELMSLESDDILGDLEDVTAETEHSIKVLEEMEVYPGGEAMKKAALDLFNFYLRTMQGPWKEALTLYVEKGDKMTDEEIIRFQELLTEPGREETQYDNAFGTAQDNFAATNNIRIEKNPMQEEIDAANEEY